MMKRCLILAATLALILPITLTGLMDSEAGSRWLLKSVISIVPGQIAIEKIQGRLLDHIVLTGLNYQSDSKTVTVKKIDFVWQPARLFSGTLKIVDVTINGVNVSVTKTKEADKNKEPTNLDAIKQPIQLDIGNILITDLQYTSEGQSQALGKLQLSAKTEGNQFELLSLAIISDTINAAAKGSVTLEKSFPLNLEANWQINTDKNVLWQGITTIGGDLNKLIFDNHLDSPFKLVLNGQVEDAMKTPRINAKGDWRNLVFPFVATPPQIQSKEGYFELNGLLTDYRLTINGHLNQQYVPQASLVFDGKGGLNAMTINKLELKSSTGIFQLTGSTSWGNSPAFDLTATGQKFNPAIIVPELPGSLTFSSRITGNLDPKALKINADIDKLNGQLRKQPLTAQGKLALNGDQLKVNSFLATLGANKLTVEGVVGQTNGDLKFALDMSTLSSFWPTLDGSLKGSGHVQGGWQHPAGKFEAQGKHLKFADHRLNDFIADIDFHPDENTISTILISADTIKSGIIQFDKLSLQGKGTFKQHSFNADMSSPQGAFTAALTGGSTDKNWKGDIVKLDIVPKDGKNWTLKDKLPLRVDKKPQGFDASLSEGCLVQQSASFCTKGSYLANGDLTMQLKAKGIPFSLAQTYLPEQMTVTNLLNADIAIQRQKNILNGDYRVVTTPTDIVLKFKETQREIHLGASSLSGNIRGDKVSADIDLHLAEPDYLKGQLLLDTGLTQAISGNIVASIAEFSVIKAIAPQLSDIKGILKADLGLQGSINKPLVSGHIDLTEGLADVGSAGLHNINLHVVATENPKNGIQLQGSAIPVLFNKPDAPEKINLNTKINFAADMLVHDLISGDFHLELPPDTLISLETLKTKKDIRLGATLLTGRIKGEALSADLDIALIGQDYLRGKLLVDLGKTQALTAQATALIRELAFIEPFAPQLSNVKGQLKADFIASGTTQHPLVNGDIHLSNGATVVEKLGISVNAIDLHAVASASNPDLIQIKGSALSGEGAINLDGTVGLKPETHFPIGITLNGKDFEVAKLPEAQIAVSPDLKIGLTDQQQQISGELAVPKAILKIQDIPENAVKVSADEIILGEEKPQTKVRSAPAINADIEVKLGKQVSFTGQGLQTNLAGNLKIIKNGEKMAMQGNVDMKNASYNRYGQDLTVRKGRFLFNGPADNPWLDVEAVRLSKSKKVTAILALTGSLKNPQTHISSEPSLPESEALAYLVTGNPLNQVSKAEGNMLASAALSYGAGKAAWLADELGIDEFKVEEGSKLQDSLLVMGEYLTPDFYVGTKVGMFNKQANIVLKHKITDTINVESQAGTSQRIKLNYEFEGD